MSRLPIAISNIAFARTYTLQFLSDLPDADWFRMPLGGVTHIAWQVGHYITGEAQFLKYVPGAPPAESILPLQLFRSRIFSVANSVSGSLIA